MAATSTYIQLSSSVLLEYEYRDQASTVNEFTTGPGTGGQAPWYLLNNEHEDSILIFNNDDSRPVTGNVRTRSAVSTEPTTAQYGLLKLDQITTLNDYDPLLTDTVDLPVVFSSAHDVQYDVVRLHLIQGFNYENTEGMYFRLSFENNSDKLVRYLNLAYRKSDNYAQLNSNPFMLGGKYYASYIEIKVPAVWNLIDDWRDAIFSGSPTVDLPASRLTGGVGPKYDTMITTEFGWIVNEKKINGQSYFYTFELKRVDLPVSDKFDGVSAVVQSSTNGDYIELYAAYNGGSIDNFITSLNNSGNSYIILHELGVYEYVWSIGTAPVWIKTNSLEFVQDSNYEDPILYRPVIQNPSASAYRIDYTVRLYNRDDNTSIWKSASNQFNDALKYAKNLQKINLGTNPIQPKVYNKIFDKNVTLYGNQAGSNIAQGATAQYVAWHTAFNNQLNVTTASMNAYLKANPDTGEYELETTGNSQTRTIAAQGLGKFAMTNSDTYIKFVIYVLGTESTFLDLSLLGDIFLNFFADSGETKSFLMQAPDKVSPASGEVMFKIPAKDSKIMSSYSNKTFTITNKSGEGESQIYTGEFIKAGDQVGTLKDRKIVNLNLQLNESKDAYQLQTTAKDEWKQKYNDATAQLTLAKQVNSDLRAKLGIAQLELETQISEGNLSDDEIAELEAQIADLEILAAKPPETIIQTYSYVDPNCPDECWQENDISAEVESGQGNMNTTAIG